MPFIVDLPLKMVISHSYVSLPHLLLGWECSLNPLPQRCLNPPSCSLVKSFSRLPATTEQQLSFKPSSQCPGTCFQEPEKVNLHIPRTNLESCLWEKLGWKTKIEVGKNNLSPEKCWIMMKCPSGKKQFKSRKVLNNDEVSIFSLVFLESCMSCHFCPHAASNISAFRLQQKFYVQVAEDCFGWQKKPGIPNQTTIFFLWRAQVHLI